MGIAASLLSRAEPLSRRVVEGVNSSGQVYRPLSLIMFAIEHDLAPNSTFLLHFINVLLYAFSAVAVWLLYRALLPNASYLLPFAAAVLFRKLMP